MFALPDSWVWDFWLVDDGEQYHLFFLYASKALKDPRARHFRASVGHAISADLKKWTRVIDAMVHGEAGAFDEVATWTGCVIKGDDGCWQMIYTGVTMTERGNVQTIGVARSQDLYDWLKDDDNPVLRADPRWYEKLADGMWHDEAFRDPWVYPDPQTGGWRMLITARANHGPADDRGVIGTAISGDLENWELLPPLTEPGSGFGQLEVMNTAWIDGHHVLFFSCLAPDLSREMRQSGTTGGVWAVVADELGHWDPSRAQLVTEDDLYVGRVIPDRTTGQAAFLAFKNRGEEGAFVGEIIDPLPIGIERGRVCLRALA